MKFTQNLLFYLSLMIKLTLIIAIVGAIITFQWLVLFVSSLTLILTFLPAFVERNYKITLPLEFEIVITGFIFASLFLGEIHSFYDRYWWWDTMLHTLSGVILGFIGFLLIFTLNKNVKIGIHLTPFFIAFFSFCFAVTMGALWEIFEWAMDLIFGLSMQKGLQDTMLDLIADSIGALFSSIIGYLYIKNVKYPLIESAVLKFRKLNPHIFDEEKKNK